jgi:hypothetical protein
VQAVLLGIFSALRFLRVQVDFFGLLHGTDAEIDYAAALPLLGHRAAFFRGWKKLEEDFRNGERENPLPTLPDPMDPSWVSFGYKVWPYRVGRLQGMTNSLRSNFALLGIPTEELTPQMSMAELLHNLERYKNRLN